MLKKAIAITFALGLLISGESRTFAGPIIGGSNLLTTTDQHQLESWLGEGGLTLTNIFSKKVDDGKTANEFHAAADGKGRTFTLYEVDDSRGLSHQIIGGYNPQSWANRDGQSIVTHSDSESEKTAFLFNLTKTFKENQFGRNQSSNTSNVGPSFGSLEEDIFVFSSLEFGRAYQSNYGDPNTQGDGLLLIGANPGVQFFDILSIEIFTIANDPPVSPAPEPASMSLLAAGALGMLGYRMRKRKIEVATTA